VRIGIIGTHGVGKTTLAAQMFAHGSRTGKKVKLIHEVARSCPLPLNDQFSIEAAVWITSKHLSLEIAAAADKDSIVICDRSCFDPMVYAINMLKDSVMMQRYYRMSPLYRIAECGLRMYDVIIYIKPIEHAILSDGTRSVDVQFQKDVAAIFDTELHYMKFDFIHYTEKPDELAPVKYFYMHANEIFEKDNSQFFEEVLNEKSWIPEYHSRLFLNSNPYGTRW
jgi:hypothetical protein